MSGISKFGESWLSGIKAATRLELWGLTYRDDEASGRLSGYRTIGALSTLDTSALDEWRDLIFDPGMVDTVFTKRVPFRPDLALVFEGGAETAILLLDTTSCKWGTVRNGSPVSVDVNSAHAGAHALLGFDPRRSQAAPK